MSNKFLGVLEPIGRDFKKGLDLAVQYLPAETALAAILFPPAVAPLSAASTVAGLLQKSIAVVEQKYAASGVQNGTGVQKSAEVLTLTSAAITQLLADPTVAKGLEAEGITVNSDYIQRLTAAAVGILNVRGLPAAPVEKSA